jgi:hypothetical protein
MVTPSVAVIPAPRAALRRVLASERFDTPVYGSVDLSESIARVEELVTMNQAAPVRRIAHRGAHIVCRPPSRLM